MQTNKNETYYLLQQIGYGRWKFTYLYRNRLIYHEFTDSEKADRIKQKSHGWKKDLKFLKGMARLKYQFSK